MITEIITFEIPDGMTRDQVVANYRRSAPGWRANADRIRKNYLYDANTRRAGGVYLWRNLEAALRARRRLARPRPPHLWQRADGTVFRHAFGGGQRYRRDNRRRIGPWNNVRLSSVGFCQRVATPMITVRRSKSRPATRCSSASLSLPSRPASSTC